MNPVRLAALSATLAAVTTSATATAASASTATTAGSHAAAGAWSPFRGPHVGSPLYLLASLTEWVRTTSRIATGCVTSISLSPLTHLPVFQLLGSLTSLGRRFLVLLFELGLLFTVFACGSGSGQGLHRLLEVADRTSLD